MVGRTRRCLALAAGATFALPAAALAKGDPWDGNWATVNEFGRPGLSLTQEPKSEPGPQVHGTFRDDSGARVGTIRGDLSDRGFVWSGTYKNTESGDKGKFRVELDGTLVHFEGWFKSCGRFTCSSKYTWTGDHA